ncbi:MAG: hypothetical protein LC749_20055, partial [Actinobacteria bacterium]|nr:hypothetical protein [Actinomycetota bacterium]
AMAREAAAQHYLTDAFAAGHLRTPVTAIRRFWHDRYPQFWHNLQRKLAIDTASALRELTRPARSCLTASSTTASMRQSRRAREVSRPSTFGDLLARVFHDWDNSHGLTIEGGGVLFGDSLLEQGVGKEFAVAGVRAGIDDVEVAYRLGASGSRLPGKALYQVVRSATGTPGDAFKPESRIPIPSADNPPQNWRATDAEALWNSPIVGTTGTTVGMAVEETLHPGAEVSRRLDRLGPGVFEVPDLLRVPVLRRWAARQARQAYNQGFVCGLAQDLRATVLAIVNNEATGKGFTDRVPVDRHRLSDPAVPLRDSSECTSIHRPPS